MKIDEVGQVIHEESEIVDILYSNPTIDLSLFMMKVDESEKYNQSIIDTYSHEFPRINVHTQISEFTALTFHEKKKSRWFMPDEYRDMDIAKWILDQCKTEEELQRVGKELLLYQERDLFFLLKQLKYIVDVWRENNIVWGVGRGSSVSSYVLYLIGVHKIDSIYYDLDIHEFLR
jgi:DNA polymerase III alpha subunit